MSRYMVLTLNLNVESVYAGFHTDAGYVVFKGDPRKHKVYMSYDWLSVPDTIVVKIVFHDPAIMKTPVRVKLIKLSHRDTPYNQVRTYIMLRRYGDEEALNFISYKQDNGDTVLRLTDRLIAKRNLNTLLVNTLNQRLANGRLVYHLDKSFDIYRLGQDNERYIFVISTYAEPVDGRVIIRFESQDTTNPNRCFALAMGIDITTLYREYQDCLYVETMQDQTNH